MNLNDLTVLFDVFDLLNPLISGDLLGSVSVPISDPSKNDFFSIRSLPGEPTSARIKSSGALFGTQGTESEKRGPKMDPVLDTNAEFLQETHSRERVLAPIVRSKTIVILV